MHVLFVCTGNTCRSPTAERLTQACADRYVPGRLTVSSAGTGAVVGAGMHRNAAAVLRELGGDPSGFRARQLTPALVGEADLVLTLTVGHRDRVLENSPRALRRTFTLREAAALLAVPVPPTTLLARLARARAVAPPPADALDIADPIGQELPRYRSVGAQISAALAVVLDALRDDVAG